MKFDASPSAFSSRRANHYAKNGMVATSQPLAAQAGLEMLHRGGNAVDAAIAAAAMLTVVEPCSNGIGGDAFAIIHDGASLYGLNSSGKAPRSASADSLRAAGWNAVPDYGMKPVTVPGTPAAWSALSKRFGRLPFGDLLEPAIRTAASGFALSPTVARNWGKAYARFSSSLSGPAFKHWFSVFAPKGRAPFAGEQWASPWHAETLRELAATHCDSFYHGPLAELISQTSRSQEGWLSAKDLNEFTPEWVEPLRVPYRGFEVCELPPNGHGIAALMALGICEHIDLGAMGPELGCHWIVEAMKLAFADALEYVADPSAMVRTPAQLLDPRYLSERATLLSDEALLPAHGPGRPGGTVYLCAADSSGTMISYIQSNYKGFGSGVVVEGTGIALHNRGANFNLRDGHPNCLAAGKRPYHTIIPGFLLRNGTPIGPFGVMGGFMQPQGHLQVITGAIDFGYSPQEALDAPRWQWTKGKAVSVEPTFPKATLEDLKRHGHDISISSEIDDFGRGQIIWRTPEGTFCGGTEPRCDGHIASM